jgi:hypothetical protein
MVPETLHPSLTERDLIPVRELIEDVRTQERAAQLLSATITWLNAFSSFKRVRRRYGLPQGAGPTHCYGSVISDLKTTGKALLACLEQGMFSLDQAPIDKENLEACVRELCCDDVILDMGLLKEDLTDIEAILGKV